MSNHNDSTLNRAVTRYQVLKVIARALSGNPKLASGRSNTLAIASAFLDANGFGEFDYLPIDLAEKLVCIVDTKATNDEQMHLPEPIDGDTLQVLHWVCLAINALTERNFSETVVRALALAPGLVEEQVCSLSGLPGTFLKSMRQRKLPFAYISAQQAYRLDETLAAGGRVYFSFLATDQSPAFAFGGSTYEQLLKRERFFSMLGRLVSARPELTHAELASKVSAMAKVNVTERHIASWCRGWLPCAEMKPVVEALDNFFGAGGSLQNQWRSEQPKKELPGYWLPESKWPSHLRDQVDEVIRFMTAIAEKQQESTTTGPEGWASAHTIRGFRGICSGFFGYLLSERQFTEESLSVSLFGDSELLKGWCAFVAARRESDTCTPGAKAAIRTLLPLYPLYLPVLAPRVAGEHYWKGRLKTTVTKETATTGWNTTTEVVQLKDHAERWQHQCAVSELELKAFVNAGSVSSQLQMARGTELIEAGITYRQILQQLRDQVEKQPVLVLCKEAACLSRQLAQACLCVATNLRPVILQGIRCEEVSASLGVIRMSPALFGDEKRTDTVDAKIEIARIGGVVEAVVHYVQNGRPFLVLGSSEVDEGYLFTTGVRRGLKGAKISAITLSADILAVLGYGIVEHRHLVLHYALQQGLSTEEIARMLHLDSHTVKYTVRILSSWKAERANQTMERLAKDRKGSK